MFLSKNMKKYL